MQTSPTSRKRSGSGPVEPRERPFAREDNHARNRAQGTNRLRPRRGDGHAGRDVRRHDRHRILYGQGLGAGRTALYRTQAVNLAADMADRIRVNRLGGADYGPAADNARDPLAAAAPTAHPRRWRPTTCCSGTARTRGNLAERCRHRRVGAGMPPTYTIDVGGRRSASARSRTPSWCRSPAFELSRTPSMTTRNHIVLCAAAVKPA